MAKKRIGIFAGTFDPVHAGHIKLALQAIKLAKLDQVYLLPERCPRDKPNVEHFGHRTAMIKRVIQPYNKLGLLELPDIHFNVKRTLPKLQREFKGSQLVMIIGGDVAMRLSTWLAADKLLKDCELVVGLRGGQTKQVIVQNFLDSGLKTTPVKFIKSSSPHVSSKKIRTSLRKNRTTHGLLSSVHRYAANNWLYVSLSKTGK